MAQWHKWMECSSKVATCRKRCCDMSPKYCLKRNCYLIRFLISNSVLSEGRAYGPGLYCPKRRIYGFRTLLRPPFLPPPITRRLLSLLGSSKKLLQGTCENMLTTLLSSMLSHDPFGVHPKDKRVTPSLGCTPRGSCDNMLEKKGS